MKSLLALAVIVCSFAQAACADEPLAGYDKLTIKATHRAEPVAASIWYPVGTPTYRGIIGDNPVFHGTYAYVGAAPKPGKYPLVLFSHGSGGNMDNLAWLSSELAKRGALVLAVNHPGSTSGDSSPRRSVLLKDRADDLKAALDTLLANRDFAPLVDKGRIASLGFSLGGTTSLGLSGARFDKQAYKAYCARFGSAAVDCRFLEKGGVDLDHLPDQWEADMKDERIASAIAVDPGFTFSMTDASVKSLKMPVLLINLGGKDRFLAGNVDENGSNLVGRIADVTYKVLQPAHHFTFLALCKPAGRQLLIEEQDDPVCDDPTGTDRAKIHAGIVDTISAFLKL